MFCENATTIRRNSETTDRQYTVVTANDTTDWPTT